MLLGAAWAVLNDRRNSSSLSWGATSSPEPLVSWARHRLQAKSAEEVCGRFARIIKPSVSDWPAGRFSGPMRIEGNSSFPSDDFAKRVRISYGSSLVALRETPPRWALGLSPEGLAIGERTSAFALLELTSEVVAVVETYLEGDLRYGETGLPQEGHRSLQAKLDEVFYWR